MIRKYNNHNLQTYPWHREQEPHINHEALRRQTKQSDKLFLPHQDDWKTRMGLNNVQQNREQSHNGSINKQQINNRTTTLERTAA